MSTLSLRGKSYSLSDLSSQVLIGLSIITWLFILYYGWRTPLPRDQFGIIFLGGMMIIFLVNEAKTAFEEHNRFDMLLIGISILVVAITTIYTNIVHSTLINHRLGYALQHEYVLGAIFLIILVYLTFRAYGLVFMLVIVSALLYAFWGPYFPGILRHTGYSWTRLVNVLVWEFQFQGVFGSINQIVATWVSLFLLYAGLLRGYGAFDLILRAAIRTGNFVKSGVAQSAVTASIIIGSITGSQMANAAITGSFTIPMMKDSGLSGETAGGIESVASSGGQIMPPIMGAAAFVMASILGVSYVVVLVAGLLPAFIFYASVVVAVHYVAVEELEGMERIDMRQYLDEERSQTEVGIQTARFIIPFLVLIWTLGVAQWTVMTAAFWTVITMLITGIGLPVGRAAINDVRTLPSAIYDAADSTVEGFRYGAITMAPIAIVVGAINGIVDLLVVTGIPGKISLALLGLSAGILALAAIIAMIVCIILGLGMPTVAAYVIVAFLIAPALISQFGIEPLAAHFFVFYGAMLSGLTPPIAVAVVVASGIASSNFWGTCYKALKVSAVLFVLPFAFIYNQELVVGGFTVETIISAIIAFAGAIIMIHGFNYYRQPLSSTLANLGLRLVYVILGFSAIVISIIEIRLAGVVIGGVLLVAQKYYIRDVTGPGIEEQGTIPED